jgi:hypothetical protein
MDTNFPLNTGDGNGGGVGLNYDEASVAVGRWSRHRAASPQLGNMWNPSALRARASLRLS